MYSYLITYRANNQEYLVEMPNLWKLVLWIFRNASKCYSIHIVRCL